MLEEKTVKSKTIYDGRVIKLVVEDVVLPNGEHSIREIIEIPNSVGIIAITKDNKIVYINQYRKAMDIEIVEIPAGCIEGDDPPEETARRELLEETGYGNGTFKLLDVFAASPATNRAKHYIFLATDVELLSDKLCLDADEFLEVNIKTFDEFEKDFYSCDVHDLKTAYAHMYLKSYYAR